MGSVGDAYDPAFNNGFDQLVPPATRSGMPKMEAGHHATALLFTENETNSERLFGAPNRTPYVKDGIDRFIVHGRHDAANPGSNGTKATSPAIRSMASGTIRSRHTESLRLVDRPGAGSNIGTEAVVRAAPDAS
jgi:hypothetical protein